MGELYQSTGKFTRNIKEPSSIFTVIHAVIPLPVLITNVFVLAFQWAIMAVLVLMELCFTIPHVYKRNLRSTYMMDPPPPPPLPPWLHFKQEKSNLYFVSPYIPFKEIRKGGLTCKMP